MIYVTTFEDTNIVMKGTLKVKKGFGIYSLLFLKYNSNQGTAIVSVKHNSAVA